MAVGSGSRMNEGRIVADPRRWAAFQCSGVYTLLMNIHSWQEDLMGALDADQLELAKFSARAAVLDCLQVHALSADGLMEDEGDSLANPFAGIPPERIASAMAAVHGVVAAETVTDARLGVPHIEEQIADVVSMLGFTQAPPSIRTPAGLFPALRITRELLPVNKAAHLPMIFPESWISPSR